MPTWHIILSAAGYCVCLAGDWVISPTCAWSARPARFQSWKKSSAIKAKKSGPGFAKRFGFHQQDRLKVSEMVDPIQIVFMATSRSGLGHVRRVATIARALRAQDPQVRLGLLTNAPIAGLTPDDLAAFDHAPVVDRAEMAATAGALGAKIVVADTMMPDKIETLAASRVLILRETPQDRLARFSLPGGRPWDLVVIPNPASHWMPGLGADAAKLVAAAGWIYRKPLAYGPSHRAKPLLLVATGGGGTPETAAILARQAEAVIAMARELSSAAFTVVQALGRGRRKARGYRIPTAWSIQAAISTSTSRRPTRRSARLATTRSSNWRSPRRRRC